MDQRNPGVYLNAKESGKVLMPRVHISELECSQHQQEILIRGLQAVSQWSQWAIDTAVGRRIDDLDYKREEAFQHYFRGDSQAIRSNIQHRFASLQYEADRSPEGRFQNALARVMIRMSLESDEHSGSHTQVSQLIRVLLNTNAVTRQQPPLKYFRSEDEEGYDPLLDIRNYDMFATGESEA
ncbi:MAG: hypothetical protein Q9160_008369 [Pyrenula sp. 1 TL-2023]